MTVKEMCTSLNLKVLAGDKELGRLVKGGYTGDLLSWVMARLSADFAWLTVIGNINAVAVASLKDAACIILTDSASLDDDALKKADELEIPILSSEKNSFELSVKIAELLSL